MILSQKQILKKCNYDLTCNVSASGITIKHPWDKDLYVFDPKDIGNFNKVKGCIGRIILKKICEDNNYPYKWTFLEGEIDQDNLTTLCEDFIENGVKREHLQLAEECNLKEEFSIISNFYFNIDKYIGTTKLRKTN